MGHAGLRGGRGRGNIRGSMLSLVEVSKAYGGRCLFAEATLQVNRGDRIGLVGPNGAGKSTLLALARQAEAPDAGTVTLLRGMTIGHLPQESAPVGSETVFELALDVADDLVRLRRQLQALEAGQHPEPELHSEVRGRYEELDGFRLEVRARRILEGLGFRPTDWDRPAREMSGGWVMRAHLGRLLVQTPDLLLLDEPTNHLDVEALQWFVDYLRTYPGGVVVISHDRDFLNRVVNQVVEIRQGRLFHYQGDYEAYLAQREAQAEQQLAAWKNQQREIARLQEFVDRFRAKNTKATQAQSKLKQIERMDKIEAPAAAEKTIEFAFPQPERSGQRVVTLAGVDYAYGEKVVYQGLDFQAERGERIVLVGANGAGKSTLLKLLAGVLTPGRGARQLGYRVTVGYYSQYRVEMLRPERTVLAEALDTPQPVTELFVRTVLGSFLFRGDDVFKPVSVLSGGEKSRLALVKLLLDPPNLLLMDEPTTHLDIPSTDALLSALLQFEGTLIFISHDEYFIHAVADHAVHVEQGRLQHYPGSYQYYLDKRAELAQWTPLPLEAEAESAAETAAERQRTQKRREAEERQARYRQRQEQKQVVDQLEAEIHTLETRQTQIIAELENPATYQQPGQGAKLNREFAELRSRLELLTADWETAASRLTDLEQQRATTAEEQGD